jgi:hypothetical protein
MLEPQGSAQQDAQQQQQQQQQQQGSGDDAAGNPQGGSPRKGGPSIDLPSPPPALASLQPASSDAKLAAAGGSPLASGQLPAGTLPPGTPKEGASPTAFAAAAAAAFEPPPQEGVLAVRVIHTKLEWVAGGEGTRSLLQLTFVIQGQGSGLRCTPLLLAALKFMPPRPPAGLSRPVLAVSINRQPAALGLTPDPVADLVGAAAGAAATAAATAAIHPGSAHAALTDHAESTA